MLVPHYYLEVGPGGGVGGEELLNWCWGGFETGTKATGTPCIQFTTLPNRSTGKAPHPLSETWNQLCFRNQNASDFTKAVSHMYCGLSITPGSPAPDDSSAMKRVDVHTK